MTTSLETALVVEVPEAEPAVSAYRLQLDAAARLGVPAHVTLLYPFAPTSQLTGELHGQLAELIASVPAFNYCLMHTDWFGQDVLWLAPDPVEPFRTLTALLSEAFPAYPPYGGRFDEVIPHLTIADRGPVGQMRAAEKSLQAHLPLRSVASSVTLMAENESHHWIRTAVFALGPAALSRGQVAAHVQDHLNSA